MKSETITVNVIKAEKGKILTDGTIYGRTIYLAKGRTADEFHEITEDEYNDIIAQEEESNENE